MLEAFRVVDIRSPDRTDLAPPEVAERFEGRLFTLSQLEQRGVRVTGAGAWYLALGRDWRLTLEPAL